MVLRVCLELEEQFLQLPVCGGLPHPLGNLLVPTLGKELQGQCFVLFRFVLFLN